MNTSNKNIAIVTGGSSGIGLAMSMELASKGYNLFVISNQQEQLKDTKTLVEEKHKVICHILYKDLTDPNSAKEIFEYCKDQQFEVEILVNNAGMLIFSESMATPAPRINALLQLHINTPTMLCRYFAEEMKTKKKGRILNVSSISAVMPYPGISLYGPSKTYMRYFTRALRHELRIYGVGVTCLLPGATETGLYDPNRINLKLAKRLGIMQTSEYVAKKAVKRLLKNKAECIPGIINKLTVCTLPLLPKWVIYQIHKRTGLIKKGSEALG